MNDREAALQLARAALPYYQAQHDAKPNWNTAARLESARWTTELLEDMQ